MEKPREDVIREQALRKSLSKVFDELLEKYGDTPQLRLFIAKYTVGYMGASFGLHIP